MPSSVHHPLIHIHTHINTSKIWLRTDGKTDGQRQNNIHPPMAGDKNGMNNATVTIQQDELTCSVHPQDIIRTNVLIKFHEEWTKNAKNTPTPGGHVLPAGTLFKFLQDIIGTNFLTKFH
ncbi:hypothetical protein DPMN_121423 [Dreissena polymorpha]|uniref:Uncharacterized protein n=1 Tax=Dreissena polymorpha TaxID=45954 RepID=A0A9D4JPI0_DREPO|nr:hypothetical protein DPMN_121423 [Dreissena polymorpha]